MVVRRREKAVWKEDVDGNHSSVTRPGQRYRLILSLSLLFFLSQMEMAGGTNDYDNFEYSGTKQWLTNGCLSSRLDLWWMSTSLTQVNCYYSVWY